MAVLRQEDFLPAVDGIKGDTESLFRPQPGNGGTDKLDRVLGEGKEKAGVKSERAMCTGIDESHDFNCDCHNIPGTKKSERPGTEHVPPNTAVRMGGVMGVLEINSIAVITSLDLILERFFDFVLVKGFIFHEKRYPDDRVFG